MADGSRTRVIADPTAHIIRAIERSARACFAYATDAGLMGAHAALHAAALVVDGDVVDALDARAARAAHVIASDALAAGAECGAPAVEVARLIRNRRDVLPFPPSIRATRALVVADREDEEQRQTDLEDLA